MAILALLAMVMCPFAQVSDADPAVVKLAGEVAAAQRTCPDTPAAQGNLALAMLGIKKARLLEGDEGLFAGGKTALDAALAESKAALKRLSDGQDYRAKPGELTELAYVAENDGTAQPYYLFLPPNYDASKKWPLIVFLHGYVPSISVLDPWVPWKAILDVVAKNGCMMLVPYGRRNTDFQGVGEVDVLESTRIVCRDYPVDEARVYMSGVSMGGMGAWNMALRHPGMYAATALMCGHTDMIRWRHWENEDIAPFKRWLMEWDNPIDLVMNAWNEPFNVQHGASDHLVPVEQSRTMIAAMKALGMGVEYREYPGQDHYIYMLTAAYDLGYKWLVKYTLDPAPREVDYKTYSLEFDRAWWTRVDQLAAWGKPAVLHAKADEARAHVDVATQNVAEISLNAREAKLAPGAEVKFNGAARKADRVDGDWLTYVLSPLAAAAGFPGPKRKGLCGPVEEVFDTPFIVVQGTAGGPEDDAKLAEAAGTWANEWDGFCDGYPRVATDAELTEEQIGHYNLVLFGTPKTNSVLGRLAGKLPIAVGEGEYKVGERSFTGADLGLVMCYPNPLAPGHYVAIYSGARYGEKLSINHKHDLLPDFLVYRGGVYDFDDVEQWACGGFFDTAWRLSQATTWVRGAKP